MSSFIMRKDIGDSFLANEMVFVPSNLLIFLEQSIHYKTVEGLNVPSVFIT